MPGEEDPLAVDGGVRQEDADRGDGVVHILVSDREILVGFHLAGMGEGHFVETKHADATAGQAPGEVLEWLVAADRSIAIIRA